MLLYILQQYIPPLCFYYSEKESSSGSSMFSFYVVLPFSRMLSSSSKQVFPSFLCFCYSVAWNEGFLSNNMFSFYAFDLH